MSEKARVKRRSSEQHDQGFSLIELLVVMAILTLLATLVGPQALNY